MRAAHTRGVEFPWDGPKWAKHNNRFYSRADTLNYSRPKIQASSMIIYQIILWFKSSINVSWHSHLWYHHSMFQLEEDLQELNLQPSGYNSDV